VIYVDSSVILAAVLAEDTHPAPAFWEGDLAGSRLAEYEVLVRLNAYGAGAEHVQYARELLARLALIELGAAVLERATQPFPSPVRTLDALHLATCAYLSSRTRPLVLATYDVRLGEAARAIGLEVLVPA
jgi:predicted nucleic acid-binding protein